MSTAPSNPHDAFFRHMMRRRADAACQMQAMLPDDVAARLDWDVLEPLPCSFVSEQLRSTYSDLLFRTGLDGHDAYIYLLMEHQSRSDPFMALRMLDYVVAIWNRHLDEYPKTKRLPAVIPLVVHASPRGHSWRAPTEVADLIDLDPATRRDLTPYLPRLRFLLDDLTAVDLTELRARAATPTVRVVLTLLKLAPGNPHLDIDLQPLVSDLRRIISAPGGLDDLQSILTYIFGVGDTIDTDLAPLIDQLGPQAKETFMTTAERLQERGRAEGRVEGRAEGRAETLIELLALKFGPVPAAVAAAVGQASAEQLHVWTARILTANSLDEMGIA
ncbi:Rpn family recombination-promoting nuclease/putative transposase [Nocardia cyriacigeorgica]|uniref:Rpn family recombination-promoting nuclease/putative transposase n=1 Tax=Nocardia cyriacigeorgica TaxID=135487 RepID=UPI001895C1B9|nr:Rpn family recombination-promoting nuclease/putative transposase [Nocardia cyriacigeorgica]MBF6081392.1 Rpn family recombination-promoting nuclease/putative transposase [Nocardia cyriacigeorgica]